MIALQWLLGAVAILAMFLLLVGPHEGGHFAFAKLFKIRVIEFSIGMGTRLLSVQGGPTRTGVPAPAAGTVAAGRGPEGATSTATLYALRAIPIGGYVRLGGMEPGDYSDPRGFHSKPAWQRLLVLAGGPLVNFLLAAVIMTGVYLAQVNTNPGLVVGIVPGSPAASQGMVAGDSILAVNGTAVTGPSDVRKAEDANPAQPLVLVIRDPNGTQRTVTLTPRYDSKQKAVLIGVLSAPVLTAPQAVEAGVTFPLVAAKGLGLGLYELATGQIPGGFFGPQGATGAVGIAAITYGAALDGLISYLTVVAALSVALGLANLLPLPALDGGRMVTVMLESLRGRPFDRDREMQVQRAGLAALLALVAVITYFDIQRLVTGQFPAFK